MIVNNKIYAFLKWLVQILLPAIGAVYFGLSQIWGLPHAEEILATLAAVGTFLGALIGISAYNYNKEKRLMNSPGNLSNETNDETSLLSFLDISPELYTKLKWLSLIVLPSCGALYFTVSKVWNLMYGSEVLGTLAIFSTFFGVLLGVSTMNFRFKQLQS